ncbi:MAG: PIN domain-containing protein, partial [Thermosynechococcaceae cyanobacterium]
IANSVFVDTSGWASLFVVNETYHPQATAYLQAALQNQHRLVTSNYVIAELVALLHSPLRQPRSQIFQIIDAIKTVAYVEIIHIDLEADTASWSLCKSRQDKAWSLVDCASFVLMEHMDIRDALTRDRHFEQAGFIRLLKS